MRLLTREQAARLITERGVIIYPTSTLYGIGCDATDKIAVKRVANIKNNRNTGFICLVSDMKMAMDLALFNDMELKLAKEFWPGPLTLILRAKPGIEHAGTGNTVALRCDPVALALVKDAGVPIISTSANLPQRPPARNTDELDPALIAMVDGVLPASSELIGSPSTIVKCAENGPEILREGAISAREITRWGLEQ